MFAIIYPKGAETLIALTLNKTDAKKFAKENNGTALLTEDAPEELSTAELLAGFNCLHKFEPELFPFVARFSSKNDGYKRILRAIVRLKGLRDGGEKINVILVGEKAKKAPAPKGPRWKRPKEYKPAKVCYKPRPKSLQEEFYEKLTQEGGIEIREYCDFVNGKCPKLRAPKTPSNVWSGLVYMFVSQKGYGLKFDGERLYLIPAEIERERTS